MQNILCIDVSTEPAQAVVVSLSDSGALTVLEQHHSFLGDLVSREAMLRDAALEAAEPNVDEKSDELRPEPESELNEEQVTSLSRSALAGLVERVTTEWSEAVLVIPPYDYLSLSLSLPFQDSKSINKIIDLEVQDLVPFEVDEFVMAHQSVAPHQNGSAVHGYDVHVGLVPKIYMRNVVALCKTAALEPLIITTSSSILATPYLLAPDYFSNNSVIIFDNDPSVYITTCIDGQIRSDRTFSRLDYLSAERDSELSGSEATDRAILIDLKLSLASVERRYNVQFDKIYYVGRSLLPETLQQTLGRQVEKLRLREFVSLEDERGTIAALAALFVRDENPAIALNNFRVREFSYSPQLTQVFRGLRAVTPYLLGFLAALTVYFGAGYLIGKWHVNRLQQAMREELTKVLPDAKVESGNELPALIGAVNRLRDQLTDVALISSHTPLELLAEVARIVPSLKSISIKSVKIKDFRMTIAGFADEYQDIENFGAALMQSELFKQVKQGESSSSSTVGGSRPFSFEVSTEEGTS